MLKNQAVMKRTVNPYLLFLPFLVIYVIYVFIFPTDGVSGDQPRYLMYAHNLMHGFYSPAEIDLRNGPGYPIILIPFVGLHLPLISMTVLNAVLHYLSIVILFKAIQEVASYRLALLVSFFWACYYIAYQYLSAISYEPISIFLLALSVLCMVRAFSSGVTPKAKRYTYLAGFVLGYLALTKVIFGYVLFAMLVAAALLWLLKRSVNFRRGFLILAIACLTTVPYLVYTYHVTGRVFYWGTGQDNLYWMTSPYEDEYGDWKRDLTQNPVALGNYNIPHADDSLQAHHGKDFEQIAKYTGLERDSVYQAIAIRNIKSHPGKYVKNIFYNVCRMLFHYPFSYATQRSKILFVLPINGIVLTLVLFSLIPTIRNWRRVSYPVRFMLWLVFLYLGASSLISAETRMFALIVPVLLFWVAYIFEKTVTVRLRFPPPDKNS